jgi:hypothetical protein
LLGTVEELNKLATRLQRPLLTISRAPTRSAPQCNPMPACTFHPQPSPAPGVRTRTVQGEKLYPLAVQSSGKCQPCAPVIRVA